MRKLVRSVKVDANGLPGDLKHTPVHVKDVTRHGEIKFESGDGQWFTVPEKDGRMVKATIYHDEKGLPKIQEHLRKDRAYKIRDTMKHQDYDTTHMTDAYLASISKEPEDKPFVLPLRERLNEKLTFMTDYGDDIINWCSWMLEADELRYKDLGTELELKILEYEQD